VSRAFLICPEPVRRLTAGVGSRMVALAQVLTGAGHQVTLAVPNDPAEAGLEDARVEVAHGEPHRLGELSRGHDWVLLHGHLGNHYLAQRDDLPVVVDLYDPFLIENLSYHRVLGFEPYRTDHGTWRMQLSRGDFFLCSSEEQRLYYLGWLTALGRVHPLVTEADPVLERLIVALPFGTPDADPPEPPPRDEAMPGLSDEARVLYFGGIYDWYDPLLVLEALPALLEKTPGIVVVFVDHPHPELTPLATADRVRSLARDRGWLGREVRFEPWRPYERRYELAQVSDIAVVTHRPGLETDLSLRTRLVDLLWLGLPVVVTEGGTMARVVQSTGAGEVVPAGDARKLAAAIDRLLGDPDRRHLASEAGRRWAATRTWNLVAAPLLAFADSPWRDPDRDRFAALAPPASNAQEPAVARLRRTLRRLQGRR
jgi:glycosyltransferase involved in cell wall biosynthesis